MVSCHPKALLFRLYLSEVPLPLYLIVLIVFVEEHLCVDKVLDHFFAAAVVEIIGPLSIDDLGLQIVVKERVLWEAKRLGIYIVGSKCAEEEKSDGGIDSTHHN